MYIYIYVYIYIHIYIYIYIYKYIYIYEEYNMQLRLWRRAVMMKLEVNGLWWFGVCFGMSGHVGLSENSVPLNPVVNDHYPY